MQFILCYIFTQPGVADGRYRLQNKKYDDAAAFCKDKAEGTLAIIADAETRDFLASYQDYDTARSVLGIIFFIAKESLLLMDLGYQILDQCKRSQALGLGR